MAESNSIAFVGLGVMGYPMAGHLAQAGLDVCVYNRTTARADRWVGQYGARSALTPALAAKGADIIFLCVGNDDDVRSVVYGETGVLAGSEEGTILVDHTTASADLARELAVACAERGIDFLDAPRIRWSGRR